MTNLFFDIECANNFDGVGKICSFGYALCGQDFSLIESDDLLMNPDAPFDWYLFKKNSRCHLAYTREEYNRNPKFPHHYPKISSLVGAEDNSSLPSAARMTFGQSALNAGGTAFPTSPSPATTSVRFWKSSTVCRAGLARSWTGLE